ncbi:DJ-1/PfpI family protein [Salininema proteolyticum]|uniref:DJ-1/PfpI family protein n=1 Tax=Salininema proteolyticum TaxID=1607685 RepID=A0ABV8U0U0_9ACTN
MRGTRRALLRTGLAGGLGAAAALTLPTQGSANGVRPPSGKGPHIGILLYENFTLLDVAGPLEVLSRAPDADVSLIADRTGPVRCDTGHAAMVADYALGDHAKLDVLLVPGGSNDGVTSAGENSRILDWIRAVDRRTTWTSSVCTGAWVLGQAGLLRGKRVTTYWAAGPVVEERFGAVYVPERHVRDGKLLTGAGVSAGQDMALWLSEKLSDRATAEALELAVEYDPRPPFGTGNAVEAPQERKDLALKLIEDSLP